MGRKILSGIAIVAGALLLAVLAATYWLFYDDAPASDGPLSAGYRHDPRRGIAATGGGAGADRGGDRLAHRRSQIAIVAGTGWGKIDMVRASYRLVGRDSRSSSTRPTTKISPAGSRRRGSITAPMRG